MRITLRKNPKHGELSLNFLISILLGLLIFIPLVVFMTQCATRLSDQAKDSFTTAADRIERLSENEVAQINLILDRDTRFVAWQSGVEKMKYDAGVTVNGGDSVGVGYICGGARWEVERPEQCPLDQPCICLCRKENSPECTDPVCRILSYELGDGTCRLEHPGVAKAGITGVSFLNDVISVVPGAEKTIACVGTGIAAGAVSFGVGGVAVGAACVGAGTLIDANDNAVIDGRFNFRFDNCKDGFVVHRTEREFTRKSVDLGITKIGPPLCDYDVSGMPRRYTIYAERTLSNLILCTELDDTGRCKLTEASNEASELAKWVSESYAKSYDNCKARVGSTCSCGKYETPFLSFGKDFSLRADGDSTWVDAHLDGSWEPLLKLDGPPCIYSAATGQVDVIDTDGQRVVITAAIGNGQLSPEYGVVDEKTRVTVPAFVKVDDKVCLAAHRDYDIYYVDNDQNILGPNGKERLGACLYS